MQCCDKYLKQDPGVYSPVMHSAEQNWFGHGFVISASI